MNFSDIFSNEKVKLIKQNSSVYADIPAVVDGDTIFIADVTLPLDSGDIIERTIPSGAKEQYLVVDPGFRKGMRGIPDHYQAIVEKQSNYTKISRGQISSHVYHISYADRVNINSTDNSTNINLSGENISLMEDLRKKAAGLDNEANIVQAINDMENHIGKPSFKEKYNSFIQSAANHMTLFAPFIPALTTLLTSI